MASRPQKRQHAYRTTPSSEIGETTALRCQKGCHVIRVPRDDPRLQALRPFSVVIRSLRRYRMANGNRTVELAKLRSTFSNKSTSKALPTLLPARSSRVV